MTTSQYPSLITEDNVIETLQEMVRLREDEDISDFTNLPNRFVSGRGLFLTRAAPSSPTDVLSTDVEGDIVNDATYEYKLLTISGTLTWIRTLLDTTWITPAATGWVPLQTVTASSDSTLDLTVGIDSTYNKYAINLNNLVVPAFGGANLLMQTSSDGGSSFDTSGYAFGLEGYTSAGVESRANSASTSTIALGLTPGNASDYGATIYIDNPSATNRTMFYWTSGTKDTTPLAIAWTGVGMRDTAEAVNAVRILVSGTSFTTGTAELFGIGS